MHNTLVVYKWDHPKKKKKSRCLNLRISRKFKKELDKKNQEWTDIIKMLSLSLSSPISLLWIDSPRARLVRVKGYLFGSNSSIERGAEKFQTLVRVALTIRGLRCLEAGSFPIRQRFHGGYGLSTGRVSSREEESSQPKASVCIIRFWSSWREESMRTRLR